MADPTIDTAYTFHIFDGIVLAIVGISAVMSLSKGFVHEVLGIGCWLAAFFVSLYTHDAMYPFWKGVFSNAMVANVATYGIIFIGTLSICMIVAGQISKRVEDSALNSLDRTLGFIFGVTRGVVLVSLLYIAIVAFHEDEEDLPDSIADAASVPLIQNSVEVLVALLPEDLEDEAETAEPVMKGKKAVEKKLREDGKNTEVGEDSDDTKQPPTPSKTPAKKPAPESSYDAQERQRLEQLIESMQ